MNYLDIPTVTVREFTRYAYKHVGNLPILVVNARTGRRFLVIDPDDFESNKKLLVKK